MSTAEAEPDEAPYNWEFEGADVVGVGYEVRGIAGGLQEPARFNPVIFKRGEEGFLLLHVVHRAPRLDPADKKDLAGDAIRVQVLDVLEGTFVSESVARSSLNKQRKINEEGRRREEEARGISQLDFQPDAEELFELAVAHANGKHKGEVVAGCEVCAARNDDSDEGVAIRAHEQGAHAETLSDACILCDVERRIEEAE